MWIAAVWLSLLPAAAAAQPDATPIEQVRTGLAALLAKPGAQAEIGLVVRDVADGHSWFEHQPDTPLKPASLMKLLVTAAALERFGPQFCYRTRVYFAGQELWVIGAGDPALGDERLTARCGRSPAHPFDEWAAALRAARVVALERLVLDDSIFERRARHPDWPADQSDRWYQPPVGGLNFNDNCLDARCELRDGVVQLILRPELPPEFIANSLTIGKRQQPLVRRAPNSDVFEFSGTLARGGTFPPASARRPAVFFGHALKQTLATHGIQTRGNVVRRSITPAARRQAQLIAEHVTPLPDVLWRCNRFSQNLFAECLLKSLAAYNPDGSLSGRPGNWTAGREVLRAVLAGLGVDLRQAVLRDGSGLSHQNRLTAAQIAQLLLVMNRHPQRAIFLDSLAVPGEEGSMRRRYADPLLCQHLRGKTGTLDDVRALAGYITRPDGTTLAFALLCNGKTDPQLPIQVARALVGEPAADPDDAQARARGERSAR